MENTMKKILIALGLLLSSCADNFTFKSIKAAGSSYCGLTDQGRAKCFRYFHEDSGGFGQNNFSPLVFDELGVPSVFSKEVFSSLKMADSPDERITRVCGYDSLKTAFCWDYSGKRKLARVFDPNNDEKTTYQLPGDFGLVTNNGKLYDFDHQNDPAKFLSACSFTDGSSELICSSNGSSIKWNVGTAIRNVVVGQQICVNTDLLITCRTIDNVGGVLAFKSAPISNSVDKIKELNGFSYEDNFLLCPTYLDGKSSCFSVQKTVLQEVASPNQIKDEKFITPAGLLMINDANKLFKLSAGGAGLVVDALEPSIASRLYQSAAFGESSACLVEKNTEKLFCYRAENAGTGNWEFSTPLSTF